MFFKKKPKSAHQTELARQVARALPDVDDDTVRLVAAIAGLLTCVAYADSDFDPKEREMIRAELSRLAILDERAVTAICALLEKQVATISAEGGQLFARDIRELCDRDGRIEVLDALVEIAAADGELSLSETNYLRRLVPIIGLSQDEYNDLQERHRDKLAVLA